MCYTIDMSKSNKSSISAGVKSALAADSWTIPETALSLDWMEEKDICQLEQILNKIRMARTGNTLPAEVHQTLLSQLLQRSPKKTGILFEVVERHMHKLGKGTDVSHDAILGKERIEIKGSRVITQRNAMASINLFDCLLGEERFFAPVQGALTYSYDCNIQQVKCRSFDRILYCLYFADAIIEFEMSSTTLQAFVANSSTGICTHVKEGLDSDAVGSTIGEANRRIAEKKQLAYSDFQHAGNEGEGQFHIKPSNILYHLVRYCKNVYSYSDFANVLKAQVV